VSAERVIEIARGELGYSESPPGSNKTKYGQAYGWDGVPWCVIFLWWCFREAGESAAFYGGKKTASCWTLYRWYQEQGQTVYVNEVCPGDIAILNFHGTKEAQHCGLVVDVQHKKPASNEVDYIVTIEGNTTPGLEGSQDNGGSVALKRRYPNQIVGVCRPAYTPDPPPPDYHGHWAEDAMRWGIQRGLLMGYEDGTYQPDRTVTRGELMTVLKRLEDSKT